MPYKDPEKQRAYQREHYKRNKEKYKEATKRTRERYQQRFRELKSTLSCEICGEDHPATLDFHHLEDRVATVSSMVVWKRPWNVILEEIGKCQVLCRNCHRKIHSDEQQLKRKIGPSEQRKRDCLEEDKKKGCTVCGKKDVEIEYCHIRPSEKRMSVSKMVRYNGLKEEMEKCIRLCGNCHRKYHSRKENQRGHLV